VARVALAVDTAANELAGYTRPLAQVPKCKERLYKDTLLTAKLLYAGLA
jgi:hypothetical protein